MRLYLIRHGKTLANELHLYCGASDVPLSDRGKSELEQIRETFFHTGSKEGAQPTACGERAFSDCRFLTSGMRRTKETLEILFGQVPYETDSRFQEMNFGVFEMGSYETLKEQADYQAWISGDNEKNVCPMGESGQQMRKRVLEGLGALLERGQDTVLVCHGGTIAIIMEELFPQEEKNRYEWQPKPGCGYLIEKGTYQPVFYQNI